MIFKFLSSDMKNLPCRRFLTWPIYLSSDSAQKLTNRWRLQNSLNLTFFFSTLPRNFNTLPYGRSKPQRPSLARIILSLESNASKQQALQHILNALHILYAREAVVSALTPHGGQPSSSKLGAASNPILDGE